MVIGRPAVNVAKSYANTLNSNSQSSISPTNPEYHVSLGNKNMSTAMKRHGPWQLYAHIMMAAFDPVYGRENSLALPEEVKPATRFPLAEEQRPHERSENVNLVSLLGGYYIKPNEVNPFQNTAIIYDTRGQGKKGQEGRSYQSYAGDYRTNYRKKGGEDSTTNKNPLRVKRNPLYKIESIARAVEQRGREYFRRFNNAHHNKEQRQRGFYESRGIGEKVAYLGQKLIGYAGKVAGYNPQSQEQKSIYDEQDAQVLAYVLPTGYSKANFPQTSLDVNLEQEAFVPRDVLDATIADAKRFLEEQRRKKILGLVDNKSELELTLSK